MGITIKIEDNTWSRLNKMKKRGETFDEVIQRLLVLVSKFKLNEELKNIK